MKLRCWLGRCSHDRGVVYKSQKGSILGKGSGIKTPEQAIRVVAILRGRKTQ